MEHAPCILCNVIANETGLFEDEYVKVMSTKHLKGHKKRIMVVAKDHSQSGWIETYMLKVLEDQGLKVFDYTYKFAIMATDFASTPDHPHYIASDLEPAEDTLQMLGTRWLKVVDVKPWTAWKKTAQPVAPQMSRST